MSETAPLQFEKAEFKVAPQCQVCAQPLTGEYFMLGDASFCGGCKQQIQASMTGGSEMARFLKASVFGTGAGIAGATVWYLVQHFLNVTLGLVALLIGWMVGVSVRKGSEQRGGLGYQVLAVFLTYCAVCWSTIPDIVATAGDAPVVARVIVAFFVSHAVPFMGIFGPITLMIIAIALWEAWRRNKALTLEFLGPFTPSQPAPASSAAAAIVDPQVPNG